MKTLRFAVITNEQKQEIKENIRKMSNEQLDSICDAYVIYSDDKPVIRLDPKKIKLKEIKEIISKLMSAQMEG